MRAFILAAALAATPVAAYAHPHIWIDYRVSFVFDASGLRGFYEEWTFDKYQSEDILQDFDTNHDGRFSAQEVEAVRVGYFENTKEYGYFVTARVDGRDVGQVKATDFNATVENGRVVYQFFVPLRVRSGARPHTVTVIDWDPSYFVDFSVASDPLAVVAPGSIAERHEVRNDLQDHYEFPPDLYISQAPPEYLQMLEVRFRERA